MFGEVLQRVTHCTLVDSPIDSAGLLRPQSHPFLALHRRLNETRARYPTLSGDVVAVFLASIYYKSFVRPFQLPQRPNRAGEAAKNLQNIQVVEPRSFMQLRHTILL